MRQFTPKSSNSNAGVALIVSLLGLLLIGAFGAYLFISQGAQGKAPVRPGIERTVPNGEPGVRR